MNRQGFAIKLTTVLAVMLASIGMAQAAGVDDGFNPDANGNVVTMVQQRNGQLLLGGYFTTIGGATRNYVARVNNDGGRSSFNPDIASGNGQVVNALHEQTDGSILIGGQFAVVSGQPRSNMARVNSAGILDTGFNPGPDGTVRAFASQLSPNGVSSLIYVAGQFDSIDGVARHGIARLHEDGSIDTSFVPPEFNGYIDSVEIQTDERVIVAGNFTQADGIDTGSPLARLNADGSLDDTFSPMMTDFPTVHDIAVQPDGKVLIAGSFASVGGQPRKNFARLHADGQLDTGFEPPEFDSTVYSMVLRSDGRIMVAGSFNNPGHRKVARLDADGSYDTSFNSIEAGWVFALVQQADEKYAIGGMFTSVNTVARNRVARLDANGAPDVDFIADVSDGPDSRANVLALQTDGKVLVGGQANSSGNSRLTRLLGNGLPDLDFQGFVDGTIYSLIAYPDGTLLVAGSFSNIGQRIARLLDDGTVDSTFSATPNNSVNAAALQRNGRILIGGTFTSVAGLTHNHLARLFANGVPDPTFSPNLNGEVYAITIQADGKSLVGGNFSVVNGQSNSYLVRLNTNGSVDNSFHADLNGSVRAIATDANGGILIGGEFATVGTTARVGIARLNLEGGLDSNFVPPSYSAGTVVTTIAPMTQGRILIGGYSVNGLAPTGFVRRLEANGSQNVEVDPDFETLSLVKSVLVQPDGKVLFAGSFSTVDGESRENVARFAQISSAIQSIQVTNGSVLSWERRFYSPELIAPPQVVWSLSCCDPANFLPLANGVMSRTGNVWSLDGIPSMGNDTVWYRAVSIAGDGGKGVGTIESPIIALYPDRIFANGFD